MIPEGHTIEDIKIREQIIRNFYREWKEKIGFYFDRSQKSICQETKTWKCKSETIRAYYDNGI